MFGEEKLKKLAMKALENNTDLIVKEIKNNFTFEMDCIKHTDGKRELKITAKFKGHVINENSCFIDD